MTTREISQTSIHADKHSPLPAQGHTPGPWRAGKRYGDTQVILDKPGNLQIALAYVTHNESELDANARLIAAAPDLLAVVQAVAEGVLSKYELREQARAAIAKAEGRE